MPAQGFKALNNASQACPLVNPLSCAKPLFGPDPRSHLSEACGHSQGTLFQPPHRAKTFPKGPGRAQRGKATRLTPHERLPCPRNSREAFPWTSQCPGGVSLLGFQAWSRGLKALSPAQTKWTFHLFSLPSVLQASPSCSAQGSTEHWTRGKRLQCLSLPLWTVGSVYTNQVHHFDRGEDGGPEGGGQCAEGQRGC